MGVERLARAGVSPTRSDPEGSSRNDFRLGRVRSLTYPHILATRFALFTAVSHGARRFGCATQFLGDFIGCFGIEIQWQIDALGLDIKAHHAVIGWANLQIGGDVALFIDAHFSPL